MKRVVITGIGIISPVGNDKEEHFKSCLEGKNGIDSIKAFDDSLFNTHRAGELKNFNPETTLTKDQTKGIGPTSIYGMVTAKMAIDDSGIDLGKVNKRKFGVSIGTCAGDQWLLEDYCLKNLNIEGCNTVGKWIKQYPSIMLANNIARLFGLEGINTVIPTACAAGNYAIGYAFDLILDNYCDYVIVGGVERFARSPIGGFNRLLSTSPDNVQPFDKNRKGLIPSEGSACLILETLENAKARDAKIYCEVLGYGLSCSANHMTSPNENSFEMAITRALNNSKINADEVDYISAHGTGTPANDKAETIAIKRAFGQSAYKIPVSSLKSMIGHSLGAASAIEAATSAMMFKRGFIIPTINYKTPDPECDLDYVPNIAREVKTNVIISNSFAFGGNDSCLILKNLIKY